MDYPSRLDFKAVTVDTLQGNPEKRIEISDARTPGLRLVVSPTGAKSWIVRFKFHGKSRKLTIGSYPQFRIAEARTLAKDALATVARGTDPAAAKQEARAIARVDERAAEEYVENVLETFVARHSSKLKAGREQERILRSEMAPWFGRSVRDITRRDVIKVVDRVMDRDAPVMASRTLAHISKFFAWCASRDIVEVSPAAGVAKPPVAKPRERVLSDRELASILLAVRTVGGQFEAIVRLLALLGQRREEVAGMKWSELFGLDTEEPEWRLPPERVKNGRAHVVPLPPQAVSILNGLPTISGADLIFTTTGTTSFSGFGHAKARLDLATTRHEMERRSRGSEPHDVDGWRLHDLRRTAASGMAGQGVSIHVVEKLLNHASGSFAGIVSVYQRHQFAKEKRDAIKVWANHVEEITRTSDLNL